MLANEALKCSSLGLAYDDKRELLLVRLQNGGYRYMDAKSGWSSTCDNMLDGSDWQPLGLCGFWKVVTFGELCDVDYVYLPQSERYGMYRSTGGYIAPSTGSTVYGLDKEAQGPLYRLVRVPVPPALSREQQVHDTLLAEAGIDIPVTVIEKIVNMMHVS